MVRGHRTCAWVLALTFLLGTAVQSATVTNTEQCQKCRPGCPMHAAGRLGGHQGAHVGCHHGREPGLRCACGNHADGSTTPLPVWRAVLTPSTEPGMRIMHSPVAQCMRALITQFVPEPPTDPPRAAVV